MASIRFFALEEDVKMVLAEVESKNPLQYVETGVFPAASLGKLKVYENFFEISELGIATHESAVGCASFLVSARGLLIQPDFYILNNGTKSFAINELYNPEAVTFHAGGRWKKDIVLSGEIGTTHSTNGATKTLNAFRRVIKKRFKRVRAYWVGPKALEALREGQRLAIAEQTPREYDLAE